MKRLIAGIVIASIVLYLFGFLWWGGVLPYQTAIWKPAVDQDRARGALRTHFPENGVYYVPGFDADQAALERRMSEGPAAFVYMLAANGRPLMDPRIMVGGFLLNLAAIVLITCVLKLAAPALPRYAQRVKFAALTGLTAAVLMDVGDIVWWQIAASWKLYVALYHALFWTIAGLILAWAVTPASTPPESAGTTSGG